MQHKLSPPTAVAIAMTPARAHERKLMRGPWFLFLGVTEGSIVHRRVDTQI